MPSKDLIFGTERWVTALLIVFTLFCLGMGISFYRDNGFDIWAVSYIFFFIIGIAGIADCYISKAILSEDSLTIIALQGRDTYPRADIESVIAEKGCPLVLKMQDGSWVKLNKGSACIKVAFLRKWLREKNKRGDHRSTLS